MELRQLEYVVAIVDEGGFTRAAERLHVTQSGVSAQVRALETDLGVELFDRSARQVRLTAAGREAIGAIRSTLAAAASVREVAAEVSGAIRGSLRIGMVVGCTLAPLLDGIARFHDAHPRVELGLSEAGSDDLVARVRDGLLDLALVGVAGSRPADLPGVTVVDDSLVAVVPGSHPIAGEASVRLARLAGHTLLCLPTGTGVRAAFDRAKATHDLDHGPVLEATSPVALADLARRGLGVAVLSESMLEPGSDLHAVPIVDADVPALLALVWSPRPAPALRALVATCRETFEV